MNDATHDIPTVLGRVPSGIFILTMRHGGQETGMLSSWVMQAGFDPPMVSVAVRHGRFVAQWLDAGHPFVLNLVAQGGTALLKHFGRGFEPGEPAFNGLALEHTAQGLPVLRDCLGYLECLPQRSIDSGDHRIYLAAVTGGRLMGDQSPMVHIRRNGMRY